MIQINDEFCSMSCDHLRKVSNDMDFWMECVKYKCELKSYLVNINMERKELVLRCEDCVNYNFTKVKDFDESPPN